MSSALVRKDLKVITKPLQVNPLVVSLLRPASMETEGFYSLRHSAENLRGQEKSMAVGVTSPVNGDGKTLVAANLAGALARDKSNKVLLVDLDFRNVRNGVASYLGLEQQEERGVVNNIRNNDTVWENASFFISDFNLYVTPSGQGSKLPYEELNSPVLGRLIQNARAFFDYIIIDSPQVVALTDTRLIAQWINGFLVVVTSGVTERGKLAEALDILGPGKTLGLIFNRKS